jgi:hypothetical protein
VEDGGNDTWSASSQTCATCLNILGILSRNDVLTSVGVLQDRLVMWGELIEGPVEHTGGEEGVNVANGETGESNMLA